MDAISKQIADLKAPIYKSVNYKLLKIKPDSRLTGTFYDSIIQAIYSTHKSFKERISTEKVGKLNYDIQIHMNNPITYEIMFDGDNKKATPIICFGIPENHATYMKQRIQGILPQSTLTFEDDYSKFFSNCYFCEYDYEKDSMLSLKIKENNFLQAILNLKNDIQKGERILLQVEMTPVSDTWKTFQDEKWDKVRKGKDVTSKKSIVLKGFDMVNDTLNEVLSIADDIMGVPDIGKKETTDKREKAINMANYSSASKVKKANDGFSVRIRAYFVCDSKMTARAYATTIETAMRELEEDNRLIMGNMKTGSVSRGVSVKTFIPINRNIMSEKELASIVNIPNQKLQREFKIDSINVRQIDAPKEMLKGKVLIGNLNIHGEVCGVYLSEDRDLTCLPLFLLTKQGGGKTTFLLNLCNDAVKAKHGLVLFDYIKNCATSQALLKLHPHCKKITFDDFGKLCTFAFPEVEILPTDDAYNRRLKANILSKEVKYLLNSMAVDVDAMSRIMSEYLTSACKIVFIHNKQTLYNVYEVLTDEKIRGEYIEKAIAENVLEERGFEIRKLRELDDKPQNADRLLDRFSVINEDTLFQEMLMKPYDSNVNFVDIMNNGEPVVIMMPQDIFTSKLHKDVICTYFMSRVRLAMSRRTNFDSITHIVVDEVHQIQNTMTLVSDTIAEPRKFNIQYVMSMHSFSQIENKQVRDKIMDVGCNFMALKGITSNALDEFKPILNGEFEYEDLQNMDYKYGSLNMFAVDNAYKCFMTELPPALRDSRGKPYI